MHNNEINITRKFSLNCMTISLIIEFEISRNEFARVGSSPELEIYLPIMGIQTEECKIFIDEQGLLKAEFHSGVTQIIEPPSYLQIGNYTFQVFEITISTNTFDYLNPVTQSNLSEEQNKVSKKHTFAILLAMMTSLLLVMIAGLVALWINSNKSMQPFIVEAKATIADSPEKKKVPAAPPLVEEKLPEIVEKSEPVTEKPNDIDLTKIAKIAKECVFTIEVRNENDQKIASGTGFSITDDGMIVTNYHVIEKGSNFSVITDQGARFEVTKVLAKNKKSDIAILKIKANDIPYLKLATTSNVDVGTKVAVYGSPNIYTGSLSDGIISAIRKNFDENMPNYGNLIQTTTSVSSGSSGSPLLDSEGKVLGVITAASIGAVNDVNFAVPVNVITAMKEDIAKPSFFSETDSVEKENNYKKFAGNDQMLSNDPIYGTYLRQVNAKNWVDTLKTAQVIVKKYPKSPGAHNCVGFSSIQLGLDDQAKQSFLSSIELNPNNPAIWNELGNILGRGDQKDLAVSAYEKAIALKPDYTLAWNNFLFLNLSMRNWDKAEKSLRTLYSLDKILGARICQDLAKFDFPDQKFTMLVKSIIVRRPEIPHSTSPTQLRVAVAQGDTLTLRNGPGVIYQPVGTIPNGAQVFVTGNSVMNSNTEWIPIQYNSHKGWVVRKYLR